MDKRAVQLLFATYWTSAGWRREPEISAEDFAYAKSKGVMFDPLRLSHDEAVDWAVTARDAVSKSQVMSAFIASLGTRRLDLRSALGSYAVARHLAAHEEIRSPPSSNCAICDEVDVQTVDRNVLNFERLKWGGVRHSRPSYIAFDLSRLSAMSVPRPSEEDFSIMRGILKAVRSMPARARLSDLDKALGTVIHSNGAERRVLIGILGYCGILIDPSKPSFRDRFVPAVDRQRTHYAKDDWPFPVQWWNGSFGVSEDAVEDWFPMLSGKA